MYSEVFFQRIVNYYVQKFVKAIHLEELFVYGSILVSEMEVHSNPPASQGEETSLLAMVEDWSPSEVHHHHISIAPPQRLDTPPPPRGTASHGGPAPRALCARHFPNETRRAPSPPWRRPTPS